MMVWRRWQEPDTLLGMRESARVVESELDMQRRGRLASPALSRLGELMRWLGPSPRSMGPPMRSIDRELEELFPSRR